MVSRVLFGVAWVLGVVAGSAVGQGLEYRVDLTRGGTQVIGVEARARGVAGVDGVDFTLPTWRSGRYVVLDFAATVRDVRATGPGGVPLPVTKVDKTTWRVSSGGVDEVTLSYGVFADSLGDRTRYLDGEHCFFDASAVLVYNEDRRGEEHRIEMVVPDGWTVVTGLEGSVEAGYVSPTYDVLADSPFDAGDDIDVWHFEAGGVPHEIAVWTEVGYDEEVLIEDFRLIAETQLAIFGDMPYERYVFMLHAIPGIGGGTEHLNSTIMMTSPTALEQTLEGGGSRYLGLLGLTAHELFHTWNVKHFRPAEFVPYDFVEENYTESLWIAEGTTSYYDELLLARSGQMKVDEFFKRLESGTGATRNKMGSKRQSLAESSWDAWIRLFALQRHADNTDTQVNFYGRGALASLCLDLLIRRETGNERSLDDVMRVMYARHGWEGGGYTPEDFVAVVNEVAGVEMGWFFRDHIRGTKALPIEEALLVAGLELTFEQDEEPMLGLRTRVSDAVRVVSSVDEEGPAFGVGFVAGDELVAIDGKKVGTAPISDLLKDHEVGDVVTVQFFRYGTMRLEAVTLSQSPYGQYQIARVGEPTPEQVAVYEVWVGQAWPGGGDDAGGGGGE